MTQWFRFYNEALDDPKVQRLAPEMFKAWVNLLCLAARTNGILPPHADIVFALRVTDAKATAILDALVEAGLLDHDDNGVRPHNWNGRQFKSDVSNERVKRHREQAKTVSCNVTSTVTETPPETDTEQKQNRKSFRLPDGFAEFWDAFPRRVGKKKAAACFDRTVRHAEATAEQLLAGAKRYAAECKGKEAQYIAHPATWLNAGRWADDANVGSVSVIDPSEVAARVRVLQEDALRKLAKGFTWPTHILGAAPGDKGCRVPADLLEKYRANWDHFYIAPEMKRDDSSNLTQAGG